MRVQGSLSGAGRCTHMCTLCRASTGRSRPCHRGHQDHQDHHGHQGLWRTRWRQRQSLKSRAMFLLRIYLRSISMPFCTHRRRQEEQRTSSCRDLFLMEDQEDLPSLEISAAFIPKSDAQIAKLSKKRRGNT